MNLQNVNKIYFIGIGGIGMSALARYFHAQGKKVGGYDKTQTELTNSLKAEGVEVHFEVEHIPIWAQDARTHDIFVVYTPAVASDHYQIQYFVSKGFEVHKRADILGFITQDSFTIAIAGTHGKTTTSCMLSHIIKECGIDCTAFLGGLSTNYNSNLLISEKGNVVVVEADEYDRSFLKLSPDIAIITSVDADHLDIYENEQDLRNTFKQFSSKVKSGGTLIVNQKIDIDFDSPEDGLLMTYSADVKADNTAFNFKVVDGKQYFDAFLLDVMPEESFELVVNDVCLQMPGKHNIENVLSAMIVALRLGAKAPHIKRAVTTFLGVKRRFEYHINNENVYIDDYAHHPEEIKVTLEAARNLFPSKKITAVFQPHLYSRTRDFAAEFGSSLSLADEVLLLDIYPAREMPLKGVNSGIILEKISHSNKLIVSKEILMSNLTENKRDVLLTLGAGDIDKLVEPIKKCYN
jgi:UDP-N-acetylmuramate--alanine ligase